MEYCTPFTFSVQGQASAKERSLLGAKEEAVRKLALEVTEQILQLSIEAEVAEALGARRGERSSTQLAWHCRRCKTRTQRMFYRNGHYRRGLTIREGKITLRMPLVRCACKGYVAVELKTIKPRVRNWLDVTVDTIRNYLAGESYRLVADNVSCRAGVSMSHVGAWRTVQEAGEQAQKGGHVGPCPEVVVLDELYVPVGGESRVFLLAVAHDGRLLAIHGPAERTVPSWRVFLDWLTERGIGPAGGLKGVVADGDSAIREAVDLVWPKVPVQQCVWHVLKRVRESATAEHGKDSPEVAAVVKEAAEVLMPRAREAAGEVGPPANAMILACQRLTLFTEKHRGKPWYDTVTRAFYEATTYLREPGLPPTNGAAERTIKELKRRTKPMDGFKSEPGGEHFMTLWIPWQNMRLQWGRTRDRLRRPRKPNLKVSHPYPKLA
jgi:transposase-like protein